MKKTNKSIIEYILLGLFIIIIALIVVLAYNTNKTSSDISKINYQVVNSNGVLISLLEENHKPIIDTTSKDSHTNYIFKVDSALFVNQSKNLKTASDDVLKISRNVLDSNTISFLYQLISFLLLGIGVFLLKKVTEETTQSERMSNKLQNRIDMLEVLNELNRYCYAMDFYSQFLIIDIQPYNQNQDRCGKIAMHNNRIKKLLEEINKKEYRELIKDTDFVISRDLLNDLLGKFKEVELNDVKKVFFFQIYSEINDNYENISLIVRSLNKK